MLEYLIIKMELQILLNRIYKKIDFSSNKDKKI